MAVHWEVFLPAVIFAHALGALLLLYSLEKVSGLVSKTWKRLTLPCINGGRTNDADQLGRNSDSVSVEISRGAPVELEAAAQKVRATSTWRRGCECTVSARDEARAGHTVVLVLRGQQMAVCRQLRETAHASLL